MEEASSKSAGSHTWTSAEDEKLRKAVERHQAKINDETEIGPDHTSPAASLAMWRALAASVTWAGSPRSAEACRARYLDKLLPGTKSAEWRWEEECIVFHVQTAVGNAWTAFGSLLPWRQDDASVKNRYYSALRRIERALRAEALLPAHVTGQTMAAHLLSHFTRVSMRPGDWERVQRLRARLEAAGVAVPSSDEVRDLRDEYAKLSAGGASEAGATGSGGAAGASSSSSSALSSSFSSSSSASSGGGDTDGEDDFTWSRFRPRCDPKSGMPEPGGKREQFEDRVVDLIARLKGSETLSQAMAALALEALGAGNPLRGFPHGSASAAAHAHLVDYLAREASEGEEDEDEGGGASVSSSSGTGDDKGSAAAPTPAQLRGIRYQLMLAGDVKGGEDRAFAKALAAAGPTATVVGAFGAKVAKGGASGGKEAGASSSASSTAAPLVRSGRGAAQAAATAIHAQSHGASNIIRSIDDGASSPKASGKAGASTGRTPGTAKTQQQSKASASARKRKRDDSDGDSDSDDDSSDSGSVAQRKAESAGGSDAKRRKATVKRSRASAAARGTSDSDDDGESSDAGGSGDEEGRGAAGWGPGKNKGSRPSQGPIMGTSAALSAFGRGSAVASLLGRLVLEGDMRRSDAEALLIRACEEYGRKYFAGATGTKSESGGDGRALKPKSSAGASASGATARKSVAKPEALPSAGADDEAYAAAKAAGAAAAPAAPAASTTDQRAMPPSTAAAAAPKAPKPPRPAAKVSGARGKPAATMDDLADALGMFSAELGLSGDFLQDMLGGTSAGQAAAGDGQAAGASSGRGGSIVLVPVASDVRAILDAALAASSGGSLPSAAVTGSASSSSAIIR